MLGARIEPSDGKALASRTITGLSQEWKKFEATLVPNDSLTGTRLFLAPTAAGTSLGQSGKFFQPFWTRAQAEEGQLASNPK